MAQAGAGSAAHDDKKNVKIRMRCTALANKLTRRQRGLAIGLTGTVIIGVDPLGARFLADAGCEYWPYSFWRALVYSTFVLLYVVLRAGSLKQFVAGVRAVGATLPLLMFLMGLVETLFMFGLVNTAVTRCLLLFSLNPLWAAALGAIILKERMRAPTAVALLLSLVSVCIVFLPPALGAEDASPDDRSSFGGDLCAALAGISFALYITLARRAGKLSDGKADVPSAAGFGGFMATAFALIMCAANGHTLAPPAAMGFQVTGRRPEWSFWLALLLQGCGVGLCLVCFSTAPTLAPAAEVGIVMLLQLLLSPLWVWLAFGEVPTIWTVIGGLLIMLTLAGHELAMQRLNRGKAAEEAEATASDGPTLTITDEDAESGL